MLKAQGLVPFQLFAPNPRKRMAGRRCARQKRSAPPHQVGTALAAGFPDGFELFPIRFNQLGGLENEQVFEVLFFGSVGPIVASGEQKAVVEEDELVVHLRSVPIQSVRAAEGEGNLGQEVARLGRLFVFAPVGYQPYAHSILVSVAEGLGQALVVESVEGRVDGIGGVSNQVFDRFGNRIGSSEYGRQCVFKQAHLLNDLLLLPGFSPQGLRSFPPS